jgi:hypothetical protein
MGAGTPVVLRSDPRPRLAEEAILLMGGDKGILIGASGPDPKACDQGDDEQRPRHADEQDLGPGGLVSGVLNIGLFGLVLHKRPLRHVSAAPDASRAVDRA